MEKNKSLSNQSTDWPALASHFRDYQSGDSQASQKVMSELMPVMSRYFRSRTGSNPDIDDLVQVVLLKIHFARDQYDPSRPLKAWVFTIASRALIDHWRGSGEEKELRQDDAEETLLDPATSDRIGPDRRVELTEDLNNALQKLKPTERAIVYLYGVEELSMAEIAQALSLTEPAVKIRAHRAYKELREILGVWAGVALANWFERFL